MAGYLIANVEVTDPARFEEYRQKVGRVVAQFGGRFIVLGGDVRWLEGNLPIRRLVVVEFPSLDAAQHFYDSAEYQPLLKIRLASTKSDVVLAAGYSAIAAEAQPRRFSDLRPGNRTGSG
ncbi:MAG TPA: DUF1330 domain-containing protein [Xanthobacteraceae bacterium]|nr:DUF1330 domain-containing protein [Xanthobacteraceae bacterium]